MTLPRELLQTIRDIEIRARKVVNSTFSGEYHSIFKGRGMQFTEVRPYQPGDDIRVMDWNVTARTGEPFIKVYEEERELVMTMVVDLSASGDFGSDTRFKSEIAAQLCATLAFSAIRNNDKVGLIAFTDKVELFIAPKKGRSHALRLIREVLYFRPEGKGTDITVALDYLNRVAKKRSIAFLVSDFRAGGYDKSLKATARKHDLIAVRIVDPREEILPDAGYITLYDPETGERTVVDTSSEKLREEYAATVKYENEFRDKLFYNAGVDQVVIHTHMSYIDPLIKFFRMRERKLTRR